MTPLFLRSGLVPNLFQLLSLAAERSPQFYVGALGFDPRFVRLRTGKFPGGFLLNTRFIGDRNSGHESRDDYWQSGVISRALSPEERWALVEYLKVLGSPKLERRLVPAQTLPWTPGLRCPAPEQRTAQRRTWGMEKREAQRRHPSPSRAALPPSRETPDQKTGRSNRGALPAQEG